MKNCDWDLKENKYISVVMSVYNEEKYVAAAIKSILNQTYPYFEFIIINDGSSDKSEQIILSFNDSRIIYKKIKKINFSAALNIGLNTAKYNYIARMDADDISTPDRLEKQLKYLTEHSGVQVLSCSYALFKDETVTHIYNLPENDSEIKEQLNYSSAICHAGSVYDKAHILKHGGYDESLDCLEDINLWLRIRKETVFHNLADVLYLIRRKENSMTSKESSKPKKFFQDIYFENFDKSYYKNPRKANEDYAYLLFKFSSKKQFREFILQKKFFFPPRIFLLFLWSFFSSKDILGWVKWKTVEVKTMFDSRGKKFQELIAGLKK